MKKLLKDIVLSATYRQDSRVREDLLEKDMRNVWLARGPRVRLSAEQVRDQALAVSGLLSTRMFGKSVKPFQPEGIWNTVYNGETWIESEGEDRYRRAIYTYSKRTSPYPATLMFDGSSREVCVSRRIRTNTPLQALVTLNDPVYVEAAVALAGRMIEDGKSPGEKISSGYYHVTLRRITQDKLDPLVQLHDEALREYQKNRKAAGKLVNQDNATPELAAMTVVANALLNLDEVITKE